MLKAIGVKSIEELVEQVVPKHIKLSDNQLDEIKRVLGSPISEKTALDYINLIS